MHRQCAKRLAWLDCKNLQPVCWQSRPFVFEPCEQRRPCQAADSPLLTLCVMCIHCPAHPRSEMRGRKGGTTDAVRQMAARRRLERAQVGLLRAAAALEEFDREQRGSAPPSPAAGGDGDAGAADEQALVSGGVVSWQLTLLQWLQCACASWQTASSAQTDRGLSQRRQQTSRHKRAVLTAACILLPPCRCLRPLPHPSLQPSTALQLVAERITRGVAFKGTQVISAGAAAGTLSGYRHSVSTK
jgi:hypothetical protein